LKKSGYPQFSSPLMPCNMALQRCPTAQKDAECRILIMRTGAYGDILMGTPLLAALRHAYPTAHLTWLVEYSYQEAIDANPYIDEIIAWNGGYWKQMLRLGNVLGWGFCAFRFGLELRRCRYDIFVSFQPEEYAPLLHGVGAKRNIGIFDTFRRHFQASHTSKNTKQYQHSFTSADLPAHRTDQYLLALKALDLPEATDKQMQLGYTSDDAAAVARFLKQSGAEKETPLIIVAPTTTWQSRNWPAERFAEASNALARLGYQIVLIGNRRNKKREQATLDTVAEVASQLERPPIMAMDCLSFRELAALIDQAALVVSGDTGPMHVAAALGTPFVGIFGPTAPEWYAPLASRGAILAHAVPCGPCDQKVCTISGEGFLRCMRLVTSAEVIAAARRQLALQVPML
jgi:ADP-heptose:LPS heptosyltransferase